MRLVAVALFALTFGILGGVLSAWAVLGWDVAFARYADGPWVATPTAFRADANPYAKARRTQRPLFGFDGSETLTFVARTDSDGLPLSAACDYRISGTRLPARRWTLTLLPLAEQQEAAARMPPTGPPSRRGFTSSEVLRAEDRTYEIALSPRLTVGNWLPTRADYALGLNLYDTTLLSGITQERAGLPSVQRLGCAS